MDDVEMSDDPPLAEYFQPRCEQCGQPPTSRELDQLQYHISLQDMGEKLQRAADLAFPNGSLSRYAHVYVLLLSWEDEDPKLPVSIEVDELAEIFEETYHFEVDKWKIPSEGSHKHLNRKVLDFIELGGDHRDDLKIVYYGGHGMLGSNRQSCWASRPSAIDPANRSVKWSGIQHALEEAESDILLLLDCCASGTANTDVGRGVTELIAACGFNTTANPVGAFSFTRALITELTALSNAPSFTVGVLYNKVLCRVQNWMPSGKEMQKPPLHVILSQNRKLPRSIQLSPRRRPSSGLRLAESGDICPSDEWETTSNLQQGPGSTLFGHPLQQQLSGNSLQEPSASDPSDQASDSTPASIFSGSHVITCPRIAISIRLKESMTPSDLSVDLFTDWLRMVPIFAENVKIEAGFASCSTLLVVSLPISMWCYLGYIPAVSVFGIIKSGNLFQAHTKPKNDAILKPGPEVECHLARDLATTQLDFNGVQAGAPSNLANRVQNAFNFSSESLRTGGKRDQRQYPTPVPDITLVRPEEESQGQDHMRSLSNSTTFTNKSRTPQRDSTKKVEEANSRPPTPPSSQKSATRLHPRIMPHSSHAELLALTSPVTTAGLGLIKSSQSARKQNDPGGLHTIHEPGRTPLVDIVFVHGLGGSSRASWLKNGDSKLFWPSWLPHETGFDSARIMTFGYGVELGAGGTSQRLSITDFAKELLFALKYSRDEYHSGHEMGTRPMVLIAHSMGGLVAKKAYILGKHDPAYAPIVSSIEAILFLATPNRGTNMAEITKRFLSIYGFNNSAKQYISELQRESAKLQELNEQFRRVAPKLDIISFYENRQTLVGPTRMLVVERDSAILGYPGETSKPLDADHHNICKFDSTADSNYVSVKNALRTLIARRLVGRRSIEAVEQHELDRLHILLRDVSRQDDDLKFFRERWCPETCNWLLSHPSFISWATDNTTPCHLWLNGLPATGKSVLSAFVTSRFAQDFICVHYFFRFGDQARRSWSTCLKTLAFQLARQIPSFRQELLFNFASNAALNITDARVIWETIFVSIFFKLKLNAPIYWIIDALDEADDPALLLSLMKSVASSTMPLKVLLVSRRSPALVTGFLGLATVCPMIFLQMPIEETKNDIRRYIEEEIQCLHTSPPARAELAHRLAGLAAGNFLWASLVLAKVMQCLTQSEVDEALKEIPSGMEELYPWMEYAMSMTTSAQDHEDRKLAKSILTWVACSRRPLSLEELEQALKPEFPGLLDLRFESSRLCGQFVVIDSANRLAMIHQTASEYLMTKAAFRLSINRGESHLLLLTKCLATLDIHANPGRHGRHLRKVTDASHRTPREDVGPESSLFNYAIDSWEYHLRNVPAEMDATLDLLTGFFRGPVLTWIEALSVNGRLDVLALTAKALNGYVRRKQMTNTTTNPLLHRTQDLELLELWATDFLKILGKFGRNLLSRPASIYQLIPPFCPKDTMLHKHFKQRDVKRPALSVKGVSDDVWDDNLAEISLERDSHARSIQCARNYFAILKPAGEIVIYSASTFQITRTLRHGESICQMSLSHCSNLLVSYGSRKTKVWSVSTGQVIHEIKNITGVGVLTASLSMTNTELFAGCDDGKIRVVHFRNPMLEWSVLDHDLLCGVTGSPQHLAFNSDHTSVAVSYRYLPLCIWVVDPPELIARFQGDADKSDSPSRSVSQILWQPQSEEVLGTMNDGTIFKWNPYKNLYHEISASVSNITSSPDGNLFATSDQAGMIRIYNFHEFAMIYQLGTNHTVNDISFSSDSKRLYDVRDTSCNIWEPSFLLRMEDANEKDSGYEGSDAISSRATVVPDLLKKAKAEITAVAGQLNGPYLAYGNEDGVVTIVYSSSDKYFETEIWTSPVTESIDHMSWSQDGKCLAFASTSGRAVVQHIGKREKPHAITHKLGSELKLEYPIQQFLLNYDGKYLLTTTASLVVISRLGSQKDPELGTSIIPSPDTKWARHPTDPELVLGFDARLIRLHRWKGLRQLAIFSIDPLSLNSIPDGSQSITELNGQTQGIRPNRLLQDYSGSQMLLSYTMQTTEKQQSSTSIIKISAISSHPENPQELLLSASLPSAIQCRIDVLLGMLATNIVFFLDKESWICSWQMDSDPRLDNVVRYYFLPADWVNSSALQLCTMNTQGTFFIPRKGEVAVVTCRGILMRLSN